MAAAAIPEALRVAVVNFLKAELQPLFEQGVISERRFRSAIAGAEQDFIQQHQEEFDGAQSRLASGADPFEPVHYERLRNALQRQLSMQDQKKWQGQRKALEEALKAANSKVEELEKMRGQGGQSNAEEQSLMQQLERFVADARATSAKLEALLKDESASWPTESLDDVVELGDPASPVAPPSPSHAFAGRSASRRAQHSPATSQSGSFRRSRTAAPRISSQPGSYRSESYRLPPRFGSRQSSGAKLEGFGPFVEDSGISRTNEISPAPADPPSGRVSRPLSPPPAGRRSSAASEYTSLRAHKNLHNGNHVPPSLHDLNGHAADDEQRPFPYSPPARATRNQTRPQVYGDEPRSREDRTRPRVPSDMRSSGLWSDDRVSFTDDSPSRESVWEREQRMQVLERALQSNVEDLHRLRQWFSLVVQEWKTRTAGACVQLEDWLMRVLSEGNNSHFADSQNHPGEPLLGSARDLHNWTQNLLQLAGSVPPVTPAATVAPHSFVSSNTPASPVAIQRDKEVHLQLQQLREELERERRQRRDLEQWKQWAESRTTELERVLKESEKERHALQVAAKEREEDLELANWQLRSAERRCADILRANQALQAKCEAFKLTLGSLRRSRSPTADNG